jgi:RNA polymerase sigma factor for flagellar operon FliA
LDLTKQEMIDPQGREPSRQALAKALDITVAELDTIEAKSAASTLLYLDHESGDDEPTLRDKISDASLENDPQALLEHREMLGTLREAVGHLPGVHGEVIRRYYLEGEMLQTIAEDHGVTQARISQIRSEALTALQAHFGTLYDAAPQIDEDSPGKRARAAFIAELAAQSTWRSRLAAADQQPAQVRAVGA